jgi:acyl carrier protein
MNSLDIRTAASTSATPRERLIAIVRQILGPAAASIPMPIDARFSELGLNSIKMVSLMLAIETEFELAIPQDDITPENFTSIATVESMISRILHGSAN